MQTPQSRSFLALATTALILTQVPLRAQEPPPFPPLTLVNYDGRPITNASFLGKTTIVLPTYAKCIFACPVVTFFLAELDAELGAPERIQYLHVSVQPDDDTAEEVLGHFDKHEIDATRDGRWLFANGTTAGLRDFLTDLGIEVTRTPVQDGFVIEHTIRVYVVGPDGSMRANFDTYFWDEEEMRHALEPSLE